MIGLLLSCYARGIQSVRLYEVPASFDAVCPVATLSWTDKAGTRTFKCALDTGAARSYTFGPDASGTVGTTGTPFGEASFRGRPAGEANGQLHSIFEQSGVSYGLGLDFLSHHDVLIDIAAKRIFISGEETDDRRFRRPDRLELFPAVLRDPVPLDTSKSIALHLLLINDRYQVATAIKQRPLQSTMLMFDTWTAETLLPEEFASGMAPTGKKRQVAGFAGTRSMVEREGDLQFAPGHPFHAKILSYPGATGILGFRALSGKTVLIQVRKHLARIWDGSVLDTSTASNQ